MVTQRQIEAREKNHTVFCLKGLISTMRMKRVQLTQHVNKPISDRTMEDINDLIANANTLIKSIQEDQR